MADRVPDGEKCSDCRSVRQTALCRRTASVRDPEAG
ncbi:hypothetical protein [Roseibium sp.]